MAMSMEGDLKSKLHRQVTTIAATGTQILTQQTQTAKGHAQSFDQTLHFTVGLFFQTRKKPRLE